MLPKFSNLFRQWLPSPERIACPYIKQFYRWNTKRFAFGIFFSNYVLLELHLILQCLFFKRLTKSYFCWRGEGVFYISVYILFTLKRKNRMSEWMRTNQSWRSKKKNITTLSCNVCFASIPLQFKTCVSQVNVKLCNFPFSVLIRFIFVYIIFFFFVFVVLFFSGCLFLCYWYILVIFLFWTLSHIAFEFHSIR